jgi:uncharacterized membrane protein
MSTDEDADEELDELSGEDELGSEQLLFEDEPAGGQRYGVPIWIVVATLVLSLLGLGDSIYLTVTHYVHGALVCQATAVINCQKVTTSPQSVIFGIPVAVLGLAYFVAMTGLNLPPLWRSGDARIAYARLGLAVVGIGMVVYLVAAELFTIKAICEYCTGVHVVTFLLFALIVTSFAGSRPEWAGER